MRFLKILTAVCIVFSFTTIIAQTEMKETTSYTYNYKKDGTMFPYQVTISKQASSPIELDGADADKINQKELVTPQNIKKMIYIDDDRNNEYDKYLVLKYTENRSDSFEIKSNDNGFTVTVDNNHFDYIIGKGVHFENDENKKFFTIDQFDHM